MNGIGSAAVIGLGLIGGSVARELTARGVRVLGYDRDEDTLREAAEEGGIQGTLPSGLSGVAGVDLVVLAVPVTAAPRVLERLAAHAGEAPVTDVGSTKASVARAALALRLGERFVGSHPLAGDHRAGWGASRLGLFEGARVFLTPTPASTRPALERVQELWRELGAHTEVVDAEVHDRRLAAISHLPQALSTALAATLASGGWGRGALGPGGRDATRLAGSSPEMWTSIAMDNAPYLSAAVAEVEARLAALRTALDQGDEGELRRFFETGSRWFHGG